MESPDFSAELRAEFEILDALGRGAMAEVYRARQRGLEREVALKVLASSSFAIEEVRARFERERTLMRDLRHVNVVSLFSSGEDSGRPYLVLELVDGGSLRDLIDRSGKLKIAQAVTLATQIAAGLAAAHALGVVHRDLKPENVLLTREGTAKVADFGLARHEQAPRSEFTGVGIIVGTPGYLAPEVIRGESAGPPADLFALGVLVFEMITGELPVQTKSAGELLVRYVTKDMPRISEKIEQVPAALDRLLTSLMARDRKDRPASAAAVVEELTLIQSGGAGGSRDSQSRPTRLTPQSRPDRSGPTEGVARVRPPSRPDLAASTEPIAKVRPASRPSAVGRRSRPDAQMRSISHPDAALAVPAVDPAPRRTALLLAGLAVLALAAGVGLRALFRPPPAPVAVIEGPQVLAGASRARLRWVTDRAAPTRIAVWREEDREQLATVFGAGEGTEHVAVLTGLSPGARYRWRIVTPDGTPKSNPGSLELVPSLGSLFQSVRPVHDGRGGLTVTVATSAPMTPGVQLGDAPVVWGERAGPGTFDFKLSAPTEPSLPLWLRFREMDTPEGQADRFRAATVESAGRVLDHLLARFAALPANAVVQARNELLTLPAAKRDALHLPAVTAPGLRLVSQLTPDTRRALRELALQSIQAWFRRQFDMDHAQLQNLAPHAFTPDATPDRREPLYRMLAALNELDAAAELICGEPAAGFLDLAAPYIKLETCARDDTGTPIPPPQEPSTREYVTRAGLPIFNHFDFGLLTMMGSDSATFSTVTDTSRSLAIPDADDPELRKGFWERIGLIPESVDPGRIRSITLRATNVAPDYALWLRFGATKRVLFRARLAPGTSHVSFGSDPSRAENERAALSMRVTVPAGFLSASDRAVSARLECFPISGAGNRTPPLVVWILDLRIR